MLTRLLALLFLVSTGSVRTDRDIVFSGQFYRWSSHYYRDKGGGKPERALDDVGAYHVFRINPDGTGLTRITKGKLDDRRPQWSTDGRHIHFVRSRYFNSPEQIWRCDADGRHARCVGVLHAIDPRRRLEWSHDENFVAAIDGDGLSLLNTSDGTRRRFSDVIDFAWSPGSRRLFLVRAKVDHALSCSVLDVHTMREKAVTNILLNPTWFRSDRVFGDLPPKSMDTDEVDAVAELDANGREVSSVRIKGLAGNGDWGYGHIRDWYPLDPIGSLWAMQSLHGMSDGDHYRTYLAHSSTGALRDLGEVSLVAAAPNGKSILVAAREWIGPYKHGGRRCGSLEILSLATGKRKPLTTKLVSIAGGDWRKPQPVSVRAKPIDLRSKHIAGRDTATP
jgi:Periplasmic component of the Tol biopolymer transport system